MDELLWTDKGKEWIKNRNNDQFAVVGMHLNGNMVSIGWKNNEKISLKSYEMKHNGITNFYLPMALMDAQCTKGITYKTIFSDYLSMTIKSIRKSIPQKTLCVVLSFPDRISWRREADRYLLFLEEIFEGIGENIFPVLASTVLVICELDIIKNPALYIAVEREWTEFAIISDHAVKKQTSAHLGYAMGEKITEPVCIRMNDYIHNSTLEWEEYRADNWLEALNGMIKKLYDNGWKGVKDLQIICPDQIRDELRQFLSRQQFNVNHIHDIVPYMVEAVESKIVKEVKLYSPKFQDNVMLKKKAKKENDDLWEL